MTSSSWQKELKSESLFTIYYSQHFSGPLFPVVQIFTLMAIFPLMSSYLSPQVAYQAWDTYPSLSEITSKSSFSSNNANHLTHI